MDERDGKTIFVQIPAYRDPELIPTLIDMIDRARRPGRVHVTVCWQHDESERSDVFAEAGFRVQTGVFEGRLRHRLSRAGTVVDVLDYSMNESRGCGWARAMAQRGFDGEDYTLQLDSHHRFARHWDSELIDLLESVRSTRRPHPVLVAHPPAYVPGEPVAEPCNEGYQIDFVGFGGLGVIRTASTLIVSPAGKLGPIPARFFSGGFAFTDGSFVRDVPADPDHYFNTEEITLAVRAYTHGYDLFHPHRHVVWHYYGRTDAPKVWDDQRTALKRGETALDGAALGKRSMKAVEAAFGMHGMPAVPPPAWLGGRRSLADYERYAGISFALGKVTPEALAGVEPSETDLHLDDTAWRARLHPAPMVP
ncbi:hypothetical protein J2T07_000989 [Luteibacter jiangsuensis]|uniref:Glycosyltransferase (GlcNAc) n=1 Tax=Luteibacter jiangsuensis TaxID=637577 RepID=A0ABT9SVM7_9GAMM|nr:GlcNAc-transferase family protein [Luteibacter jiangsuensis]MDQ0008830.1 hypothetical protein [Luteibacter jiangsuensis]